MTGLFLSAVLAAMFSFSAFAGERTVPRSLDDVRNPRFRIGLEEAARDYDRLDRRGQVEAYIAVYRRLNYGEAPLLVAADRRAIGDWTDEDDMPGAVPPPPPYYIVRPSFRSGPSPAGAGDVYIEGYGYRRMPDASAYGGGIDHRARDSDRPLQVGEPDVTGTGAAPYAAPFVARPREAPTAHAGP